MRLDPGSPEAIREGCRCSPVKNRNGEGAGVNGRGEKLFIPHLACGLHGSSPQLGSISSA